MAGINYEVLDHKTEDDLLADIERKFQKIYTSLDPETSRVIEMLLKPTEDADPAAVSPRGTDDPFKIPEELVEIPEAMAIELEKAQRESGMTTPDFMPLEQSHPQDTLVPIHQFELQVPSPDISQYAQVPSPDFGSEMATLDIGVVQPPLGDLAPTPILTFEKVENKEVMDKAQKEPIFASGEAMDKVANFVKDPIAAALEVAAAVEALDISRLMGVAVADAPLGVDLAGGLPNGPRIGLSTHFSELDVLKGLRVPAHSESSAFPESSLVGTAEQPAPVEPPAEPEARAPVPEDMVKGEEPEPDAIEAWTDEEAVIRAAEAVGAPELTDLTQIIKQADAAIAAADAEISKTTPLEDLHSPVDPLSFLPMSRDKTDLAMHSPRKQNEQKTPEPPDLLAKYLPARRKTLIMQQEPLVAEARSSLNLVKELNDPAFDMPTIVRDKTDLAARDDVELNDPAFDMPTIVRDKTDLAARDDEDLNDLAFDMPTIVRDKTDLAARDEQDTSPPDEDESDDKAAGPPLDLEEDPSDDLIARAWKVLGIEPDSARSLSQQQELEHEEKVLEEKGQEKGMEEKEQEEKEQEDQMQVEDKAEDLLARAREVLEQPLPQLISIPQQTTPVTAKNETTPSADVDLSSEDGDGRNKGVLKSTRSDSVDSNRSTSSSLSRRRAQGFAVEMPKDLTYQSVKSPRPGLYTVPEGALEDLPELSFGLAPKIGPKMGGEVEGQVAQKEQVEVGGGQQGQSEQVQVQEVQVQEEAGNEEEGEHPLTAFIDDALEKLKCLSGGSPSVNEDADVEPQSSDEAILSENAIRKQSLSVDAILNAGDSVGVSDPLLASDPLLQNDPASPSDPSGILREEPPLLSILMNRTREEPGPVSIPHARYRYKAESPKPVADPVFRLASPRKKSTSKLDETRSSAQDLFNPLPDWRPSVSMRRASSYSRAAPTVPRKPPAFKHAKSVGTSDLLDSRTAAINRDLHLKVTKFTFCKGIKFARVLVRVENSLRHPVQLTLEPTGRITSAKVLCEGKGENPEFVLPRDEVYLMVEGTGILKVYAHAYRQRWSSATWRLCHQIPVPHEEDLERCRIKQSPKIFWAKLRRRPVAITDETPTSRPPPMGASNTLTD